ncbi:MAG TPA: polysaccharide biosynthesis tyrosine autokinase [Methylomirabilota bacterium]|nr:polysaccharide biosynthesis tyrosine autokinase [Methylomirabilota bacterium]
MADPPSDRRSLPPGGPEDALRPTAGPGDLARPDPSRIYAVSAEDQPETHFWDYWRVLVRHKWTVITFFLVAVIVGTVYTYTQRPVFVATATLRIEKEEFRVVKFEEVLKADSQVDYYQTQHSILQSRTLAARVVGLLKLEQHPEFQSSNGHASWISEAQAWTRTQLVRWIPVPPPPAPALGDDLVLPSPLTDAFLGRLSVAPVRGTRLVQISFRSFYPDLAARAANTLAEAFITYNLDHKLEASRYATRFLTDQIEAARRKLEEADAKLNQFLAEHDLIVTPGSGSEKGGGERLDFVTKELVDLSSALYQTRADRIAKESVVAQALSQDADSVPAVLGSSHIAKLKEELANLEGEYRKLSQMFKPEYPRMQRMEQNITEVRRQIRAEVGRAMEALESDYRAALRKEQALQKEVDGHREVARRLGAQMTQYTLLRRDVDTSHEHYQTMLTRLKEVGISSALVTSTSPITIVDRAEVPMGPSEPRARRTLLLSIMVGLMGGIGLAFFFEYLDTNIKDTREVETTLRVPTLGLVPSRTAVDSKRRRRLAAAKDGDEESSFALVAHTHMGSVIAEAFRNVRTSLLYSAPEHPPKAFMVTSLQTEDGKTSLASNLAITLAQLGKGEILLIDGDMRRPDLHEIFGVPKAPGLSTFLTGQVELPAVVKSTRIPNLHVIPAGRTPTNPAELLASGRLSRAIEVLQERFAHIVFDTPPLFGVSDALILSPRLEGVVLVLRHGRASRDAARRALHLLTSVRARVLGVILNDADGRGAGYYGYYGYYGYGYGYGGPRGSESGR